MTYKVNSGTILTTNDIQYTVWAIQMEKITIWHLLGARDLSEKIHEIIEGLDGIEVVADDFLIVGRGKTYKQSIKDYDRCLKMFLEMCNEKSLHINQKKIQYKKTEVEYIGHRATNMEIKVGLEKILQG